MSAASGYWSILCTRFRLLLQYRAAAAAGIGTQLFWGFIRVMIFTGFYQAANVPQPMTLQETIGYIWLGQAMITLLPWSVDPEVREMVRTGNVAHEFLRPLDLYTLWYTRAVALRSAPVLLRAVPLLLLATLFFGLPLPPSAASAAGWIAVTLGALALSSAITALMSLSLLWTLSGEGISRLMPGIAFALSGMILPLPLCPEWVQPLLDFLPFRDLADVPFRVYLGHLPPEQVPAILLHQLVWISALVGLGRWLASRAGRRLVVQGG